MGQNRPKVPANEQEKVKARQRAKPGMQEFEDIFGKDIDEFLEN